MGLNWSLPGSSLLPVILRGGICSVKYLTLPGSMASMSLSSEGIQLGARWQFWKKTQLPCSMALCNKVSARGPCRGRKGELRDLSHGTSCPAEQGREAAP